MSDWQKGDLALCVKVGPWREASGDGEILPAIMPRSGRIYTVCRIECDIHGVWLFFIGFEDGYHHSRFRKVTPPKADEFDREVIEAMSGEEVPA